MKIDRINIRSEHYVEFSTGFGSGIGSCKNIQKVGKEEYYIAELDMDIPIKLNQNAVLVSEQRCFIRFVKNKNEIQGVVESIDEERFGYLRLATDCLLMIEIASDEIKNGDYLLLTVGIDDLRIQIL